MNPNDEFRPASAAGSECISPSCFRRAELGVSRCFYCEMGLSPPATPPADDGYEPTDAQLGERDMVQKYPAVPSKPKCAVCPKTVIRRTKRSEESGKYWADTCSEECDVEQKRRAAQETRQRGQAITRTPAAPAPDSGDVKIRYKKRTEAPVQIMQKSATEPLRNVDVAPIDEGPPKPQCARAGCTERVSLRSRKPGQYWRDTCSRQHDAAWRAGCVGNWPGVPVPPRYRLDENGKAHLIVHRDIKPANHDRDIKPEKVLMANTPVPPLGSPPFDAGFAERMRQQEGPIEVPVEVQKTPPRAVFLGSLPPDSPVNLPHAGVLLAIKNLEAAMHHMDPGIEGFRVTLDLKRKGEMSYSDVHFYKGVP